MAAIAADEPARRNPWRALSFIIRKLYNEAFKAVKKTVGSQEINQLDGHFFIINILMEIKNIDLNRHIVMVFQNGTVASIEHSA